MQLQANNGFHDLFGDNAVSATMGEYTVYPDGRLARAGHADQRYNLVEQVKGTEKVAVICDGTTVVIEAAELVSVTMRSAALPEDGLNEATSRADLPVGTTFMQPLTAAATDGGGDGEVGAGSDAPQGDGNPIGGAQS